MVARPVILGRVDPTRRATGLAKKRTLSSVDQQGRYAALGRTERRRSSAGASAHHQEWGRGLQDPMVDRSIHDQPRPIHLVADTDRGELSGEVEEPWARLVGQEK